MAARSLNKIMLIGNMTRDPELRYTPQGTAVCSFGIATNRFWVTDTGEKREETEFHRIVAWNKLAELCSQLLAKGRKVYVEGRLQTRTWTAQDGSQRTTTEIVINEMIILDSRRLITEALAEEEKIETQAKSEKKETDATTQTATPASVVADTGKGDTKRSTKQREEDKETPTSSKPEKKKEADQEVDPEDIPF